MLMVSKSHIPKTGKQIQAALKDFETLRPKKSTETETKSRLNMTPQSLQQIKQLISELS